MQYLLLAFSITARRRQYLQCLAVFASGDWKISDPIFAFSELPEF
jgi:hypothetical protein